MENKNENPNQGTAQGADYSDVMTMFDNYDNSSDNNKPKTQSKEDILAKYFTPRNSIENFRVLPPLAGRKIIEEAFFHYVPVNKAVTGGKGWRKIYCPAHNSPKVAKLDAQGNAIKTEQGQPVMVHEKCPLCENAENIKKSLDTTIKYIKKDVMNATQLAIREKNSAIYKEAGKWEARKYSIIRGVDKGMPKDGVKFWRFKHNFKNQGVLDKLVPALRLFFEEYQTNPTDVNQGSDLYINVVDSQMPNGNSYKDVSSITAKKPSKLYDDDVVIRQWLADKTIWRDVFKEASMTRVLNSKEYLERVAVGTDPYWDARDEDNKRYVFPDPADAELMGKANEKSESLDSDTTQNYEMASDVAVSAVNDSYGVNITNVTAEDVGTPQVDNAVDVGAQFTPTEPVVKQVTPVSTPEPVVQQESASSEADEYDDLPF